MNGRHTGVTERDAQSRPRLGLNEVQTLGAFRLAVGTDEPDVLATTARLVEILHDRDHVHFGRELGRAVFHVLDLREVLGPIGGHVLREEVLALGDTHDSVAAPVNDGSHCAILLF